MEQLEMRDRARQLRANMTRAERVLWEGLRRRALGVKFRRQSPIGPYVADFVSFECRLVVEVDGSQHVDSATDMARDAFMQKRGFRVLRFWNHEVLENPQGVLESIALHTTVPLRGTGPEGRGGGAAYDAGADS